MDLTIEHTSTDRKLATMHKRINVLGFKNCVRLKKIPQRSNKKLRNLGECQIRATLFTEASPLTGWRDCYACSYGAMNGNHRHNVIPDERTVLCMSSKPCISGDRNMHRNTSSFKMITVILLFLFEFSRRLGSCAIVCSVKVFSRCL